MIERLERFLDEHEGWAAVLMLAVFLALMVLGALFIDPS